MDNEAVKKEICITYEYSYLHDDWVQPLGDALDGITAEEAVWRAGPQSKGIWEIVLHLAVWTDNIIERIETRKHCRPVEGAWPSLPEVRDEAAWAAAQKRLWDALDRLKTFIEESTLDILNSGPYGLADLMCRFTHNGYHIGQIVKMRELRDAGVISGGSPAPAITAMEED